MQNLFKIRIYLFNYDNFKPTNIFEKDKDNNDVYFMFDSLSKGYIISDIDVKSKLINLEGYKYFFFPIFFFISPILIPIILTVFFLQMFLYFVVNIDFLNYTFIELLLYIAFPIYLIILFLYFYKIKTTLKNCSLISKEEKEWIFSKKSALKLPYNNRLKIITSSMKSIPAFKFKKIHIFYTIIFFIISFPFWFVIAAILL